MKNKRDYTFEDDFERISPASFAQSVGRPIGWFVVHYGHIPIKRDRRWSHGVRFSIKSEKDTIYRMLRFSPRVRKNNPKGHAEIVLDWIGWLDLNGRDDIVDESIRLTVKPVPWWWRPRVYLSHPDPAIRLSAYLGWTSVALGLVALPWPTFWSLALSLSELWVSTTKMIIDHLSFLLR
jgi:hypothetical protein